MQVSKNNPKAGAHRNRNGATGGRSGDWLEALPKALLGTFDWQILAMASNHWQALKLNCIPEAYPKWTGKLHQYLAFRNLTLDQITDARIGRTGLDRSESKHFDQRAAEDGFLLGIAQGR
jgi:hypothetical protein